MRGWEEGKEVSVRVDEKRKAESISPSLALGRREGERERRLLLLAGVNEEAA